MIYMIAFVCTALYEFVRWIVKTNPVKGLTHNESIVVQYRHNKSPETAREG